MATYYVWSGATGTNAGTSWTNAYTAFGSAVTAATVGGDVILVHYTHQENVSAATTYTFGASVNVISVDKDSSDAPTVMGTGGWIGHNTISRIIAFNSGAARVSLYGITVRTATTTSTTLSIVGNRGHWEINSVYFWHGSSNAGSDFIVGSTTAATFIRFVNCTFRFGGASQSLILRGGRFEFDGCTVSSAGTAPSILFDDNSSGPSNPDVKLIGCDLSYVTGTLLGNCEYASRTIQVIQCKLGANVTPLGTQTYTNKMSGAVYLFDCSSGDTHGLFGYYDAFGSCVSDTGIYYTTGAAAQSWKITTTANCSYYTPFTSPFVDFYNTGTSSITPYFEILRDGSTTAYQNDEVWGEFFIKSTSGSTQSTPYNDRMALLGTPANQASGAGTGSWTGEAASAWSGKIDSGSAVTPAEVGAIRGRVVVGEPSITVYVDPQVRT